MKRRLEVVVDRAGVWAEVRGYRSRDLIQRLTGRAPVYNTRTRHWCCQAKTARDLIAVAEAEGYEVDVQEAS